MTPWDSKAKNETFTWSLPGDLPAGTATVTATVWYSKLVSSVAEYMGVPAEEAAPIKMSEHTTTVEIKSRG